MNAVELKNVSYVYSPDTPFCKTALSDVSLSIKSGIITGIIGHTGSGKSTLAQLCNGLIEPTQGEILINGKSLWENKKDIRKIRFQVGLVFQYPEYQLFEETVYKDIAFGPKNMGFDENEIDKRINQAIKFVGISEDLLQKSPFDLSGGQKRRVAVAGVMAMKPEILILDEPAAGLDPKGREDILTKIKEYHKSTGNTVIMISHSMEDMARYCDEIVVLKNARPIMQGTVSEIFENSNLLSEASLTVPQITQIMIKLKEMGHNVNTSVFTVEAAEKELKRYISSLKNGGEAK